MPLVEFELNGKMQVSTQLEQKFNQSMRLGSEFVILREDEDVPDEAERAPIEEATSAPQVPFYVRAEFAQNRPHFLSFDYGDIIKVTKVEGDNFLGECEGSTFGSNTGWFSKANHKVGWPLQSGTILHNMTNPRHHEQIYTAASPVTISSDIERIFEGYYDRSCGVFRCEHPSCWDCSDKFRFKTFAELMRHYEHDHARPI